jgi:hypothetical protein
VDREKGFIMSQWKFFPIWGLNVVDDQGLESPIFGDATIVSRQFIASRASSNPEAANLLSGGGFRDFLQRNNTQLSHVSVEDLVEMPPGAYIAVRRKKDDDAARYGQSIRALLTSTFVKTGGQVKGFSMNPWSMHWSAIPKRVWMTADDRTSCEYTISVSNCLHLRPLLITQDALRKSWSTGTPVCGTWRMFQEDALSNALVGPWQSLSPLKQRIRDASIVMSRAMESPDNAILTLFGTVSLEILFGSKTGLKDLEELANSLFSGERGPDEISSMISNRHQVAHRALSPDSEGQAREVGAGWFLIIAAAEIARHVSSVDDFIAHLRNRVEAAKVAARFRAQGNDELAEQVIRQATFLSSSRDG